jgi:hypothetical protein
MSDSDNLQIQLDDVSGNPTSRTEWAELLSSIDEQIARLQEKCESGRVYNAENEKIRIKWNRQLIAALSEKKEVLKESPELNKSSATGGERVYVVKGAGMHKIGVSSDPRRRIKNLQTGSPVELELVYQSPPTDQATLVEQNVHESFDDFHSHGEWFELPAGVVGDVINDIEDELSSVSGTSD